MFALNHCPVEMKLVVWPKSITFFAINAFKGRFIIYLVEFNPNLNTKHPVQFVLSRATTVSNVFIVVLLLAYHNIKLKR